MVLLEHKAALTKRWHVAPLSATVSLQTSPKAIDSDCVLNACSCMAKLVRDELTDGD